MDTHIRGILEKELDGFIQVAGKWVNYCREFRPHISSEEDMTFGFIVGSVMALHTHHTNLVLRRDPTPDEVVETFELAKTRASVIMGAIRRGLT